MQRTVYLSVAITLQCIVPLSVLQTNDSMQRTVYLYVAITLQCIVPLSGLQILAISDSAHLKAECSSMQLAYALAVGLYKSKQEYLPAAYSK